MSRDLPRTILGRTNLEVTRFGIAARIARRSMDTRLRSIVVSTTSIRHAAIRAVKTRS